MKLHVNTLAFILMGTIYYMSWVVLHFWLPVSMVSSLVPQPHFSHEVLTLLIAISPFADFFRRTLQETDGLLYCGIYGSRDSDNEISQYIQIP